MQNSSILLYNAYLHNHDIHSGDEAVSLLKEDEENQAVKDDPNDAKNRAAYPASVQGMIRYLSFMVGCIVSNCKRNQEGENKNYHFHVNCRRMHITLTLTVRL